MPPFRHWADLPPDLLCLVGDGLDLKCYSIARGVCKPWRCALAPPSPSLLVVLGDDATCCPSAASLLTRRSFELKAIPSGTRCVGSSNGWLVLTFCINDRLDMFSLFNPVTAKEIILPPLVPRSRKLSKIVFAPNPARYDFAAAAICDHDMLAYVTAGARRWAVLGPVRLAAGDRLADLVYHEKGKVYCLTGQGDLLVLRLSERRPPEPAMVDDPSPVMSRKARNKEIRALMFRRSAGQDLKAPPATVEPLLALPSATNFAWPYSRVSDHTSAKNLVFVQGNLYQIWRNAGDAVTLQLSGGGHRRVEEDEVFVLRYYPRRQPCWVAVTDLGGHSVFLGRNNAVAMYAEDVPGLKGNCVYWIGGRGTDQAMAFDMATGTSAPCLPSTTAGGAPQTTICWYFLRDMMNK